MMSQGAGHQRTPVGLVLIHNKCRAVMQFILFIVFFFFTFSVNLLRKFNFVSRSKQTDHCIVKVHSNEYTVRVVLNK